MYYKYVTCYLYARNVLDYRLYNYRRLEIETKVVVINNKRKRNCTKRSLPKTHTISARLDDVAYKKLLEKKKMTGNNTSEIMNDLVKNKRIKPFKKIREIVEKVADIDTRINRLNTDIESEKHKNDLHNARVKLEQCKQGLYDLLK